MNKKRRLRIDAYKINLAALAATLSSIHVALQDLAEEEQSCMDNMPESLQESQRYASMEEAYDALSEAVDLIADAIENLETAQERLEDAQNVD